VPRTELIAAINTLPVVAAHGARRHGGTTRCRGSES
jgi:hypothetical protein